MSLTHKASVTFEHTGVYIDFLHPVGYSTRMFGRRFAGSHQMNVLNLGKFKVFPTVLREEGACGLQVDLDCM